MVKSVVKTFCRCFFEKANSRKSQCLQGSFLNDCKAFRGFAFRAERVFARGGVPAACMLPKHARYQLRHTSIFNFGSKHTKRSVRALRATVSGQPKCLRTHLDLHSFFRTYILYHEIASLSTFFCKILRFFLHLFLHTSQASRFFSIHNCTRNIS